MEELVGWTTASLSTMEMSAWTTCNYRQQRRQTTGKQHSGKNTVSDPEPNDGTDSKKKTEGRRKDTKGERAPSPEDMTGNEEATVDTVGHVI